MLRNVLLATAVVLTAIQAGFRSGLVLGEVVRVHVTSREPYQGGKTFGAVGPYERVRGTVEFALDPEAEANRTIVDLPLAPRQKDGRVHFSADFDLLMPRDLSKANGVLLYEVNNRGNRLCLGLFNGGCADFLFRRGYIVVWSGWIAEVLPGGDRLLLDAPRARGPSGPIRGPVRQEFVPNRPRPSMTVTHWENMGAYPPTDEGLRNATLTWRLRERDPRVPIPRAQWRLNVEPVVRNGRRSLLPRVTIEVAGGLQPGYIYELIYEAQDPIVQGVGLAGIRDLVAMLRYERRPDNPLWHADLGRSAARYAIAFGASQSGRCLRQFLYDGFNRDERGRRVFDGMFIHIAGGGLGFFNHRFASPTRHGGQHDNHSYPVDLFPFSYATARDPFTGRTASILDRARQDQVVPKIFHVQTSAEYWHRSGSLVHTDPEGRTDLPLPPEVRLYAIGGAQHGPGDGRPRKRTIGTLPHNHTDYRPICRALLFALTEWVTHDRTPPASVYPTIGQGTLVPWQLPDSGWQPLPGVRYPEVIQQPECFDFGPEFETHRILSKHPPASRGRYTVLVPRVGPDNNELGMLLPPNVAVPTGTYTGWNLRHRSIGAENELLGLAGGFVPFPRTAEQRQRTGDPRPSLEELYPGGRAEYLKRFQAAVERLIAQRFCLPEDRNRWRQIADACWQGIDN